MSQVPNNLYRPVITGTPQVTRPPSTPVKTSATTGTQSFKEMLQNSLGKTEQLTFSKHAQIRTQQRGIYLDEGQIQRLDKAMSLAEDKGLTQTLVMMDNNAFIVHVPNKVVITVFDGTESENSVFTNIDGAVII